MCNEKRKRASRVEGKDCENIENEFMGNIRGIDSIESSKGDLGNIDANEQLIKNSLKYYPEEIQPTIHSLCRKYGSSRFQEIFQLANTIGSNINSIPYLQVVGMPGTGKYSLVKDMLKKNDSVFGYMNGTYTKWLCNSKGGSINKISIENLFIKPIEQIRKKLIKKGIFNSKKRKSRIGFFESDLESSSSANNIIEFIDELRLIKKEYSEYLKRHNSEGDSNLDDDLNIERSTNDGEIEQADRVKSRSIFLIIKDVTTISKNRPDLLLTLMKLHEHLRDVIILPAKKENFVTNVNFSLIFIDNYGIPEDFFCSHTPFPVIWFSSYNDIQSFDIMANLRLDTDIKSIDPNDKISKVYDRKNSQSLLVNTLLTSYVKGSVDFIPKTETNSSGIKLNLLKDDTNKQNIISIELLYSIWTEFIAEIITVLHPYLKSDFKEIIFKVRSLWPVFLLPLVSGELYFTRNENYGEEVYSVTQTLLNRFKRHYAALTKNIYSHFLPELFQGDLISNNINTSGILNYGFLKNVSQINMPYFTKLLLVSAYVASKVPKKDDKTLFHNLVASKLKSKKAKRKNNKQSSEEVESRNKEAFSLLRWIAIADCIALHITGKQGIELSVPILEQINDIVRLGLVIPVSGKWSQLVLSKGDVSGPLFNISPLQDLTLGQNIGLEIAMYKQGNAGFNSCSGLNNSYGSTSNNLKLTYLESPINIEDPRALYIIQAPNEMIEAFSIEIGVILKEIIPEN
ncbi:ORC5 like AAA+ ATpase [Cryptosporidium sp. chipmunk genotype I]|uniref:ORC5 like AAA+ ATpase n=1 Tax=Cryptosporidium sp. chipmunk genotype I TaxID=1280935 RepID=UPI00351A2D54|nr:ORC5 like AAA+ ATpase [Cryptosporidium sp. chipmunk genotype I]